MYLKYFDKFLNQEPYFHIDSEEWEHIKTTFDKDDVKESMAKVAMTYPPPFQDIEAVSYTHLTLPTNREV